MRVDVISILLILIEISILFLGNFIQGFLNPPNTSLNGKKNARGATIKETDESLNLSRTKLNNFH